MFFAYQRGIILNSAPRLIDVMCRSAEWCLAYFKTVLFVVSDYCGLLALTVQASDCIPLIFIQPGIVTSSRFI